ncbi:hypothetical protein [Clostridium sp. UBA6640]|uniref:hypothetical protein n=1 Tax=Clostridium sp. UBA6640 TaxID=1946370 RepID=UPI0025C179D6|nr:hypothetical protein [Clostridium sp. UBA6640]
MFLINYEILEDEKNRIFKLNNIMEFESDVNTVMGQIQLIFNNTKEGFVDKDIPFSGEFLITWFKRLNDALIQLKESSFVAIELSDSDSIWLEFKLNNEEVLISEIKAEKEMHIEKFIVNLPKRRSELFWCESISKDELFNTILDTTNNFMKDILAINQLLAESKEFKELEDKYIKAKNCLKQ